VAFIDRDHDAGRTLLLVGSPRSGTTWLAEVLTEALHCRLIFEPLRTKSVPWTWPFRPAHYIGPQDPSDPALEAIVDRILTGRIRNRFTDKFNTVHLPHCRLVKEVRATNLLPWIVDRYPHTPVIYLLRHPVPTSWSVVQLGWQVTFDAFFGQESLMEGPLRSHQSLIREKADSPDLFERTVLHWCLENLAPIQMLDASRVHVVFYEQAVEDPQGELKRLQKYLDGFDPTRWRLRTTPIKSLGRASHTNHRGTDISSGTRRLEAWVDEVGPEQVETAVQLVRGLGLGRLYGKSTRPLISPGDVLQGGVSRGPTAKLV